MLFKDRENILVEPTDPDGSLIVALHGGGGTPQNFKNSINLETTFPRSYIIYVAAEITWEAGGEFGDGEKDYDYIRDLIKELVFKFLIYVSKINILGYSNGAMMAYRFVNKNLDYKFASVTCIAGAYVAPEPFAYTGKVLHIHGKNDEIVPVLGNEDYEPLTKLEDKIHLTAGETIFETINGKHSFDTINTGYPSLNIRIKLFMGL